MGTWLWKT